MTALGVLSRVTSVVSKQVAQGIQRPCAQPVLRTGHRRLDPGFGDVLVRTVVTHQSQAFGLGLDSKQRRRIALAKGYDRYLTCGQ